MRDELLNELSDKDQALYGVACMDHMRGRFTLETMEETIMWRGENKELLKELFAYDWK